MTHLLDTNSCIDHLRRGAASKVTARLSFAIPGSVAICSVVAAELIYGAYRSAQPARALQEVASFCGQFTSLPFDDPAADQYGLIRAHLTKLGTSIGPNDLLIAAIALANDLTLVTHNTNEFSRVPGLRIEDWLL
ncbi:MAG: type II toxin-antitoxin system VapC family toxin [Pirellulaceae bacterium]